MWKAYTLFLPCCWTPVCRSCHEAINHPMLGSAISLVSQAVATAAKWSAGTIPPQDSGASSIILNVFRVADERTTTLGGLRDYFPVGAEKYKDDFFSVAVCSRCRPCDCFPSTAGCRGTLTWVGLKLQSIMCDCRNVAIHTVLAPTDTHWIKNTHRRTCMSTCFLFVSRSRNTKNKVWWEKWAKYILSHW